MAAGQFHWEAAQDEEFYDCYLEWRRFMGQNSHPNWLYLAHMYYERSGHALAPKVLQNRFDYNEKSWREYEILRKSGIQVRWDQETGKVVGDDQWWENAIQVAGEAANKFRRMDVERSQVAKWEEVYGADYDSE